MNEFYHTQEYDHFLLIIHDRQYWLEEIVSLALSEYIVLLSGLKKFLSAGLLSTILVASCCVFVEMLRDNIYDGTTIPDIILLIT